MISAEERADEWVRRVTSHGRQRLPLTAESIAPKFALPSRRAHWRLIQFQSAFTTAAVQTGRQVLRSSFSEIEGGHRAIVREIEHAREVFAFGAESAGAGDGESTQVALEAVNNAIALLEYQRRTVPGIESLTATSSTLAIVQLLLEYHECLDRDRLSTIAKSTHRQGLRFASRFAFSLRNGLLSTMRGAELLLGRAYRVVLIRIGLMTPPRSERQAVEKKLALADLLNVSLGVRDLPAIYRRLFRLAPVEDPRFLVGRRGEIAGIANAMDCWQSGRGAAVIVVGARGSGKTSLLNCAVQSAPSVEALRSQFSDRIGTPEELDTALRRLLSVPEDTDLISFLQERPRLIVIEEFERIFLRTPGGLEAVHRFVDIMQSTGVQALWMVSTNEVSYRFLCAACSLDRFFSHTINAMSVSLDAMTAAILQRHNLSGLRLVFAPVLGSDPRVSHLREIFGLTKSPEQLFFESLHSQSEGIYRSAFELWQDCIERVEAGTIYMAQPLSADYSLLERELKLDDYFALQAILQHGSMTAEELGVVLRISLAASHRRVQRLRDLQILEPEPAGPGLRVKPQSGKFVRDVLAKRNLV